MLVTFSGQRAKYERGLLLAIMSLTTVAQPQMLRIIVVSNKYLLFLLRLLQTLDLTIAFKNHGLVAGLVHWILSILNTNEKLIW